MLYDYAVPLSPAIIICYILLGSKKGKTDMRFLMVSGSDLSKKTITGAQKRFLELAYNLKKRHEVIMISNLIDYPEGMICYDLNLIKYSFLPKHIGSMISQIKALLKLKNKIKYDYAISFSPVTTICYGVTGYKNVISLFRENLLEYQRALGVSKLKIIYFSFQEIMAVHFSEKIIVQCQKDKNDLIKRNKRFCKKIEKKVFIQINNVNASWMNYEFEKNKQKNSDPKILFIGNFSDRRKGHSILLQAASILLDQGYKFELYIAGGGKELSKFQEKYNEYPQIIFLNYVTNVNKYLQLCDFEIVPSLIDSCPNTVLEAINVGLAVYGSNVGGIPDILGSKKYMFEPHVESLYNFLRKIITDKSYIDDAKEQNLIKKKLTFDWSQKIEQICAMK